MPIERKLTAIVFTDIAGFTELSAQDEENAFALIETQRNVLKPIVKGHGGQWLKEIGDGLLLSFPSSIQAVNCAIAIQDAVRTIDNLALRIGVHQGDILQKDDDIFGDDVNIASRIQEYAPVDGIAISQKVEADISSHPIYQTKYIGQPKLKGVKQEIKIFSVSIQSSTPSLSSEGQKQSQKKSSNLSIGISAIAVILVILFASIYKWTDTDKISSTKQDTVITKKSIAVLYFDPHSPDIETEFWCSGMTEEVITALDKLGLFDVKSRSDVIRFKDKEKNTEEIKKLLNVDAYLEGSLQRSKNKIRITAQLIDANSGFHLWSETYDRPIDDILEVQDEISQKIAVTLGLKLADVQQDILEVKSTESVEAFDKASQGLYYFDRKMYDESLVSFNEAILIDPSYSKPNYYIGLIHQKSGHHNKAIDVFKKALPKSDKFSRTLWEWKNETDEDVSWEYFDTEHIAVGIIKNIDDSYDRIILFDLKSNKVKWEKDIYDYALKRYDLKIINTHLCVGVYERKQSRNDKINWRGFINLDIQTGLINNKYIVERKNAKSFILSNVKNWGYNYKEWEDILIFTTQRDSVLTVNRFNANEGTIEWTLEMNVDGKRHYNLISGKYSGDKNKHAQVVLNISGWLAASKGLPSYKLLINLETGELIKKFSQKNNIKLEVVGKFLALYYQDSSYFSIINPSNGKLEWEYIFESPIISTYTICHNNPLILLSTEANELIAINTAETYFNIGRIKWQISTKERIKSIHRGKYDDAETLDWFLAKTKSGNTLIIDKEAGTIVTEVNNEIITDKIKYSIIKNELYASDDNYIYKINPISGSLVWKMNDTKSYNIRKIISNCLVVVSKNYVLGLHKDQGQVLWRYHVSSTWPKLITNKKKDRLYIGSNKNLIEINLKQNPESTIIQEKEILTNMSQSLIDLGKLDEAKKYLKVVTETLDPGYADALWKLSQLYRTQQNKNEMIKSLTQYINLFKEGSIEHNNTLDIFYKDAGLQWSLNEKVDDFIIDEELIFTVYDEYSGSSGDISAINKINGDILWKSTFPSDGNLRIINSLQDSSHLFITYTSWKENYGLASINKNNGMMKWIKDFGRKPAEVNVMIFSSSEHRRNFLNNEIIITEKYNSIRAINKNNGELVWIKDFKCIDSFKYKDKLFLVYEDSVQIVEIESGIVKNTIPIAPKIYVGLGTNSKIINDQFIYVSEDTTYVTLDLISGEIMNEIKSPYNRLYSYLSVNPYDIILERDEENIIAFKKDNSNQDGFIILWEKEFDDELNGFNIEKEILNMYFKNDYKIVDMYTGIILHEYYNLWTSHWNRYFDQGILYLTNGNIIYAIQPNTKWEQ